MFFSTFLSGAAFFHLSLAGYVLEDDYMKDFYGNFDFFTSPDPTNGFVKYVDQSTAQSMGLMNSTNSGAVSWGVDSTNKTPEGRSSVRISSKKSYNSGLVVLDVEHMPVGCGTWPAFWMVGPSWPDNGEIDILEGVNEQEVNAMTLHTGPGCSISSDSNGAFAGEVQTSNCDVKAADQDENAGCSIKSASEQSYGAGLNAINGGVYATQWTDEAISVYFFPRGSVPQDALGDSPDPTNWGTPAAKFAGACDIKSVFKEQQIVFDTTFCGDWAGRVWSSGSCASKAATCEDFVRDSPEAFANAYWTINSLKVYQDNGNTEPAPSSAPVPSYTGIPVPSIVPSDSPIDTPTSTLAPPAPLPTGNNTFPTIAPPGSPVPSLPPVVSTSDPTVPTGAPAESHTRRPHGSRPGFSTPSQAFDSLVAAPTGGGSNGPMHGFSWPKSNGQSNNSTPAESTGAPVAPSGLPLPNATATGLPGTGTGAPIAAPSTALAAPTTIVTMPVPSAPAAAPVGGSSSLPLLGFSMPGGQYVPTTSNNAVASGAVPTSTVVVESEVVQTVYETLYVTVSPPEATPAPGSKRARHVRQHRRRMTQHNARR